MKKLYLFILLLSIAIFNNFLLASEMHIACANGDIETIKANLKYKNELDLKICILR